MPPTANSKKYKISVLLAIIAFGVVVYWFRAPIWDRLVEWYHMLSDREQIRDFISSFGPSGPPLFIFIQVLQVIFAPVPGEATGFIGGYLFGTLPGFIYSSIGLTLGSWLNFSIGRLLGHRWVRKLIPAPQLEKIDAKLKRQGIIVVFILFLIPGFPKDYLCLALGLTTLPAKLFFVNGRYRQNAGYFRIKCTGRISL